MTDLLAIVPARAGSKGVPGKNKALIGGRPLIEYTIASLKAARAVEGIVVTSDDSEILSMYRGREDIFLVERPATLEQDDTSTAAVIAHALDAWNADGHNDPDSLLLAQPTTPLRTSADIDSAFERFQRTGRGPVISACRAEGIRHPQVMYRLDKDGEHGTLFLPKSGQSSRRQDFETLYQRNGAIYIASAAYFRRTGQLRNASPLIYEMPWERSINIDGPGDLIIAKALIESGLLEAEREAS